MKHFYNFKSRNGIIIIIIIYYDHITNIQIYNNHQKRTIWHDRKMKIIVAARAKKKSSLQFQRNKWKIVRTPYSYFKKKKTGYKYKSELIFSFLILDGRKTHTHTHTHTHTASTLELN